jgi:hypothetical protein
MQQDGAVMAGIYRIIETLPIWSKVLFCLMLVALIGYIDVVTLDYSLLVFYLLPISIASWYIGRWSGAAIALVCGSARFIADSSVDISPLRLYSNSVGDTIFLLIVAFLIAALRTELTGKRNATH